MSSAGHATSSSGCVARPGGRETGLIGFAAQIRRSSPIGSYVMETVEHREPCESRGSRTVLGARGGEIPPRDSTKPAVRGMSSASPLHLNEPTSIAATFAAGSANSGHGPPFRTAVMEHREGIAYIGLMLAATITLPHFLVSSEMSLPKSAGEPGSTVPPRLASRALNFGSAMLILTSLFSLSMSSTGVLFGAPMPNHALAS